MIEVTRRFGGTPERYPIYTPDEAEEEGLRVVHWTRAEAGDWCRSDDGLVVHCFRTHEMPHSHESATYRRAVLRVMTVGRPICNYDDREDPPALVGDPTYVVSPYLTRHDVQLSACSPGHWTKDVFPARKEGLLLRVTAGLMLARMKRADGVADLNISIRRIFSEDELAMLAQLGFGKHKRPVQSYKRWLKQERIKTLISMDLVKLLEGEGFTPKTVIDMYDETYTEAKKQGQTSTMKGVADVFRDMLAMYPERQQTTHAVEYEKIDFADEPPSELGDGSEIVLAPAHDDDDDDADA